MKNLIRQWANLYKESIDPEFHAPEDYGRDDEFDIQADNWEEIDKEKKRLAKELSLTKPMKECDKLDEVRDPMDIINQAKQKKTSKDTKQVKNIKIIELRPDDGYVFAEVTLGNGSKQEVEMEITKADSIKEFKRIESLFRKEFKMDLSDKEIDSVIDGVQNDTGDDFDVINKDDQDAFIGTVSLIRQEALKDPSNKDNVEWLVPTPDFDKVSYARGKEGEKERKEVIKAMKRELRKNRSDDFAEINAMDGSDDDDEKVGKEISPETVGSDDYVPDDNDDDVE